VTVDDARELMALVVARRARSAGGREGASATQRAAARPAGVRRRSRTRW
jgi:hypothetical protein